MQVSLETLSGLERRMTIEVPAEQIESQVQRRLNDAAKTFDMKGFRKGKVPLKVIKNRFGKGVRQEVVGEVMSQSYYEAVNQEKVRPAGQPQIEPKSLEEGKALEFTATFEVYPEITLSAFSEVTVEKKNAEIKDTDVDTMIETLRKQRQTFQEVDRASKLDDQVDIDFTGTIDGEVFEGGEGKGTKLVLGSKRMIEGFEDGLVGSKAGDEQKLSLTFPEDYQNKDYAGKAVEFAVKVNAVAETVLPELNDEFFASFDVQEGGEEAFRKEVTGNMERELKNASRNNLKGQIIEGLLASNVVSTPKALVENQIDALREQTLQQFGGGANIDKSMLPAEMFQGEAEKRVAIGLIMNEIALVNDVKADPAAVRTLIEEMAASYEQPEEVISYYYSNKEQLASVESMAMEEAIIDLVLEGSQVTEVETSYEEALKPVEAKQNDEENAEVASDSDSEAVKDKAAED